MNASLVSEPAWLAALRGAGKARFEQAGLPTQRQEAWKYTGLNRLKTFGFEPSLPSSATVSSELGACDPFIADAAHRLVFVDGRFDAARSEIGTLPPGAILGGLAAILRERPEVAEPLLGRMADIALRPMAALNAAWIEDGFVLILPRGASIEAPIEVTFIAHDDAARSRYPRNLISLGDNAEAIVIERHIGGAAGGFTNKVSEVGLGSGASLRHYAVYAERAATLLVDTVTAEVGRDAQYRGFALTAGGGLVRREVAVALKSSGASGQVDGAYLVDGDRHADTTILIDHQAPHCASRQTQKGVIDGHGRAVFQGKILVRPGAQKTDGYQLSQTLLLSQEAEIDVKPELEIHADDVKCSHGATIGRLDADALFFLRARGIPEQAARALLIEGFIGGALDEIDHPAIRDAFKAVAARWLADQAARESGI